MDITTLFKRIATTYTMTPPLPFDHPTIQFQLATLKVLPPEIALGALKNYWLNAESGFYDWAKIMQLVRAETISSHWADAETAWGWAQYILRHGEREVATDISRLAPLENTIDQLGGLAALRVSNTNDLRPAFIGTYRKVVNKMAAQKIKEWTGNVFN